ncbi:MAG: DUF4340 domain-containing protein [Brevinematia bacterium]
MRGKTLTILSLLLVLAVLLLVFFIFERGEVKVLKKQKFLVGEFTHQDVSFVSVYFRDYYDRTKEYRYTLFKSNDTWFVSHSNVVDRVDPKLGNFVVNILGDIESLGTISSNEVEDINVAFGFNIPNAEIEFDVRGKTNRLRVGNLAPTKDYYYTLLNDNYATIYLVYAYKIDNILKYPYEIRDRNIFTYQWTNVMGFEYKPVSSTNVFVFTNSNKVWFLLQPLHKEVDSVFVETEFLKNLRSIQIEYFIDRDDRRYSLFIPKTNSPISYIRLYNAGERFLLLVLTNISTNFYCFDPQRNVLFAIDYESTKSLFASGYERFVKITN